MNNLSTSHSVQKLLKELQHLVKGLKNDPADIPQLELDLMKEKIRTIYDILSDVTIQKVTDQHKEAETITQPKLDLDSIQDEESVPEPLPGLVPDIEEDVEIEVENTATDNIEAQERPPSLSEPTLSLFDEPLTNSDDIEKKSVGEKIAEEKSIESVGEAIQSKKITSLKLAIGINEKFFFLNELFDGKMNEYNDAIEELDQKETFKDAMEYLVLLFDKRSWEEESEAYNQLKGFLEKKFN